MSKKPYILGGGKEDPRRYRRPVQQEPRKLYFDPSEHEKTGNFAVDMVGACVGHYRKMARPIKTITLNKKLFAYFEDFVKEKTDGEYEKGQPLTFDGVNIVEGTRFMLKEMEYEFYTVEDGQVLLQ